MLGLQLEPRQEELPKHLKVLLPLLAVGLSLGFTLLPILAGGHDPIKVYYHVLIMPLVRRLNLLETLVKATPLIITGAAVALAFIGGFWNIGAEGQMLAGALAATWVGTSLPNQPALSLITLMMLIGFVAGAGWAVLAAILKLRWGVHEVLSTLLMNEIMAKFVSWVLNGPWRNPISLWPESIEIPLQVHLPIVISRSRLHAGLLVALALAFLAAKLIKKTTVGFEIRMVGANPEAALYAGVNVRRAVVLTALISGGLAGLAGVSELAGVRFHMIEGISAGYGYGGIVVASLAMLNLEAVVPAALLVGMVRTGADSASRSLGVSTYLGQIIEWSLLITTLTTFLITQYRVRRRL